ncbi:PAS domain S-box protein [bacterium]|nr:PAS domain S-box protein [bacterium]MBU1883997.1 PAS domain S-box protein [bacterium]
MKIFTFLPIEDISNHNVGYIFAIKNDNTVFEIFLSQLVKFILGVLSISVIYYYYQRNRQQVNTIEQLQNAIDQTTLVSKTDLKGRITYANDAFVELSGYSREELIGQPHSKVRHPDMPASVFKELWDTIQDKKIWHGTIKNRKKDGGSYTVDATILPKLDINKNIKEYIAIRHDITQLANIKEHLSKELNISNKNFAEAYTRAKEYEKAIDDSNIVSRTDLDGNITYVNKYFCEISGYTQEELIGQKHSIVRHPDMPDAFFKEMWETISSGRSWHGQMKNRKKGGDSYFVESTIVPIFDTNGKIVEYLGIRHDVTEIVNFHKELESTQKEVIYKMGEVGESRSQETGQHVKRVAEYSRLLALLCGMDDKEADLLHMASPMHDIGKVGIPDSILKKPGKLDPDEWVIMQSHAEIGYKILNSSQRPILKAAAIVSYEHHEKWNGTGYPNKLEGESIHIYGRITAIADVFDALGSDRCYKKAWELERIIELFKEEKGKHFDPYLVELFLENLDKFLVIRDTYKDVAVH